MAELSERGPREEKIGDDTVCKPPTNEEKPSRMTNFWTRTWTSLLLLFAFALPICMGHFYCGLLVLLLNIGIFKEILSLKRNETLELKLSGFRRINWYFFCCAVFFLYPFIFENKFSVLRQEYPIVEFILRYHKLLSFSFYMAGFLAFVLLLEKGNYKYQFQLFFWTHLLLLFANCTTIGIVLNIYNGLIWFFYPALLVISNDTFAYIFGFFFGKTPLIELSPKKTWEGFIGGFFSTILLGLLFGKIFVNFNYVLCPADNFVLTPFKYEECEIPEYFIPYEIDTPGCLQLLLGSTLEVTKFQLHSIVFSMFASLVAPFGGFFASGFKRAFRIKDFGNVIPGHGGLTDRFDCQFIMGLFVYVYSISMIFYVSTTTSTILAQIAKLDHEQQMNIYNQLRQILAPNI